MTIRHNNLPAATGSVQTGATMIEVLVSLIILMVGLLGLAGLMVQSQRSEMESYQRVQALVLLQDMVGRITANRAAASCYVTTDITAGAPYLGTDTVTGAIALDPGCTAQLTYAPKEPADAITTAFCTTAGACTFRYMPTTANNLPEPAKTRATAMAVRAAPIALLDLRDWNDLLNGAAETSGATNAGAMVGARGCISYNSAGAPAAGGPLLDSNGVQIPGTGVYTVQVVWQGTSDTFARTDLLCGTGLYGAETRRRVVSLAFRIGSINNTI